jgi:hypothetical protein
MERKLVHVEKIEWIKDIKDADNIQLYGVLGWQCVGKKNEFKVGEKVAYIEIDSVMPELPEYEFLRTRNFRIRTIKLKGEISQGLIIPLPENLKNEPIGADLTGYLGVTKYLSPSEREEANQADKKAATEKSKLKKFMYRFSWYRKLFLSSKQKQSFPYWVSKTDEERIQNIPHVLGQFKDCEVYVTEKIDYQSATFTGKMVQGLPGFIGKLLPKKFQFVVCSRNLTVTDTSSLYWKIAKKYNIEKILKENPTLTIQGEQGDTKVQGNKYGIKEPMFWVFNIIDHEKGYQYNYPEMYMFCKKYSLNVVPLLSEITHCASGNGDVFITKLSELGSTVPELVEYSKGKSVLNNQVEREGIVVRCIKNGKKLLSFKVINPNFLIKFNE